MGKSSKKRDCPAINQTISRADCGQNRHTRYPCPAECPHDPFAPANYDQFLEIESHLDKKTIERMPSDFSRPVYDLPGCRSLVLSSPVDAGQARAMWKLFHETNAAGQTWAQGWEAEGFRNLKNDEVTIFKGKMGARIALLEIRCVVDTQTVEALDLLNPDGAVFRIVDRSTAARTVRFMTYLGWIFPTPHFWKLTCTAIEVHQQRKLDPVDLVKEMVRYHGGPDTKTEMEAWLAENYPLVCETLLATAHERRRQMFSGLDLMMGEVEYELTKRYRKCRKRLDSSPFTEHADIEEKDLEEGFAEARTWFTQPQNAKTTLKSKPRPMLGSVLLGQEMWRLEASSGARLAQLRTDFETLMGDFVRFKSERRDDTSAQLAIKEPEGDRSLIPPRLLEYPEQLGIEQSRIDYTSDDEDPVSGILGQALSNWADEPVPALDGLTPRAAANDLLLRPRVISLVKGQVTNIDRMNLREGRTDDINGLIRELGLHEIDEPPPPKRPVPEDSEADELIGFPGQSRASAETAEPFISFGTVDGVLGAAEAESRFEGVMTFLSTMDTEDHSIEPWVLEIVTRLSETTDGLLQEAEFSFLIPMVVIACHTLVPPGARAPAFSISLIESTVLNRIEEAPDWSTKGHKRFLDEMTTRRRQPELAAILVADILAFFEDAVEAKSFAPTAAIYITVIVTTVMDEIDRVIRG